MEKKEIACNEIPRAPTVQYKMYELMNEYFKKIGAKRRSNQQELKRGKSRENKPTVYSKKKKTVYALSTVLVKILERIYD